MSARHITQVVTGHHQSEGGGFIVRRPLPTRGLQLLDPLLLIDELGPIEYGPGEAKGAPDHPHRGFETVTYLLSGASAHADSAGHSGVLNAGDVQWMTAGSGVVHREMPAAQIQAEGGRVHGFQVWVNLPKRLKGHAPRYLELKSERIPEATTPDGLATVRVIAGEALGVSAAASTLTPVVYHHWTLRPGAAVTLPVPLEHNLGVYVFSGRVQLGEVDLGEGQLAVTSLGDTLSFSATEDAQFLLLGGQPIGEPVAWGGPFVMNTRGEVKQAYLDYQAGRMGQIPPEIVLA